MEALKLIGVLIVIVGFIMKLDTIATVVIAGIVTGLVGGMSFLDILETLGSSFLSNRLATLFVLTLPIIGIAERYGLKDKAGDLIRKAKRATTGIIATIYEAIRSAFGIFGLRINGHPQFVRPLINPMAQAAATAQYGKLDEKDEDNIKGLVAANENFGNFFAQNCFMGASGTLLIVTTLMDQGYNVDALQIAMMSIPIAVIAFVMSLLNNLWNDKKLRSKYKGGN